MSKTFIADKEKRNRYPGLGQNQTEQETKAEVERRKLKA